MEGREKVIPPGARWFPVKTRFEKTAQSGRELSSRSPEGPPVPDIFLFFRDGSEPPLK